MLIHSELLKLDEIRDKNERHVSFSVRHSYYDENNLNLKCILNYFVHNANVHNPLKSTLATNDTKVTSMHIKQSDLESNDLTYTLFYLLLLIIFPLFLCSIPMAATEEGPVTNHLFYSLCVIPLLSTLLSIFCVIWMEVFFECKFKYRILMMAIWTPISALLHFIISLMIGKLMPCGLDVISVTVVIGTGLMTFVMLPSDQRQEGYLSQIVAGMYDTCLNLSLIITFELC